MMLGPCAGASHDSEMLPSKGSVMDAVRPVGGSTGLVEIVTSTSAAGPAPMALWELIR